MGLNRLLLIFRTKLNIQFIAQSSSQYISSLYPHHQNIKTSQTLMKEIKEQLVGKFRYEIPDGNQRGGSQVNDYQEPPSHHTALRRQP